MNTAFGSQKPYEAYLVLYYDSMKYCHVQLEQRNSASLVLPNLLLPCRELIWEKPLKKIAIYVSFDCLK